MTDIRTIRQVAASHPALNMAFNKNLLAEVFFRFGTIIDIGHYFLRQLRDSLTNENVNAIITEIEMLYDSHIGPIDMPWIPNSIEPVVDAKLKSLIRPNLETFADWIREVQVDA